MTNLEIAQVCHEVNAAYCQSLGDFSQKSWIDAPEWQRESAVNGVVLHRGNITSPSDSHENWMAEKVASGWVYGAEKDETLKTHPCIVSFDDLPANQKAKDFIFKAVVDSLS